MTLSDMTRLLQTAVRTVRMVFVSTLAQEERALTAGAY